ncbi:MAG: hypothetical protein ABID79_01260 [Elusimicrobiota bacterium]
MKKILFLILSSIFCLLFSICLYAKQNAPLPVFIFNGRPVDAKAIGMGEAFVAVSDNASAAYWNPAGLKQLEEKYFTTCINTSQETNTMNSDLFYSDSLQGKKLTFISFANSKSAFSFRPISSYSSLFENKKIEVRVNKYTFSSASQYTDKMQLGINISYISANLGIADLVNSSTNISDGNGIAFDFGLLYTASKFVKLGFSVENSPGCIWWADYRRSILKSHIRTGLSIKPSDWFLMSADYENIASIRKEFYHGGLQQTIGKHIFLRQGIIYEPHSGGISNFNKQSLTFGTGYELKKLIVDLALESYKIIEGSEKDEVAEYTFSLSILF